MFTDGNKWTYVTDEGEQVFIEVMPGFESFNGYSDAKKVKILSVDEFGVPEDYHYFRYYKKDDSGFYELGSKKYVDYGSGFTLDYTLEYTTHKKIVSLEMNINDSLVTNGSYTVGGYTISYEYTTVILGNEEVTIPYGTFNALKFSATLVSTPPGFPTETSTSSIEYVGSSSNTVDLPDAYEPDDIPAQATVLMIDAPQDHSFSVGESDWFVFQVP
ncbi:MAG: hypothetical protein K8S13_23725 [Desulfobacula sp.]|uniref:hypothetical protein n=1 Tax=Desulfobacula sp. TaxID=2593537 RepID=UPI0025BC8174|nr:hypothetical protein [Desulfobacula sp.]MCD4722839.1 hypothetical protein [Desulfobacula sp.]